MSNKHHTWEQSREESVQQFIQITLLKRLLRECTQALYMGESTGLSFPVQSKKGFLHALENRNFYKVKTYTRTYKHGEEDREHRLLFIII